ncbi:MgtC/SapB family protein [Marinagarivorans cellulosilyticus]|uniref:Protein MgtC n=1 Tax=Marinagarivorans cellulosilyticus TaxID=2721545 RepID=A0AAN1WGL9_9GAMM|nr:MgtC/SapB family protein [Marinagarivorans cellulosilyticus]BCD97227.1 putative Mg2+ transporter-C family protein [Marinagarivorans cellulosilyticus]
MNENSNINEAITEAPVTGHYQHYFNIDIDQAMFHVMALFIAYIIALPIGIERSRIHSGLGLRTVSIVAMACCAFVLIALNTFTEQSAQAKFFYGILTGIGFIGGGALFKSADGVYGTASAASVWASSAIGVSVALAMVEIALVLSAATTLTLVACSRPNKDSDQQA